jgi:hypothetical protein
MNGKVFKYDVAFSFLAGDENLAIQINDLIQDRVRTFIYSRKQGEIAGTEETFNRVFSSEARIVFVLYREGWGKTPWTRIEESAIRNRAYEKGYDFVLFAPLDKSPAVPKWLPKNRIWIGLERWGIEGAASIIEARIHEAGGETKEETCEQRAVRFIREISVEEARQKFLGSEEGVKSAESEVAKLFAQLERIVKNVSENEKGVYLSFRKRPRECSIDGNGFSISLHWSLTYRNTLSNSALYLYLWKGSVHLQGEMSFKKPEKIKEMEINFDLDRAGNPVWRERGAKKHYSTENFSRLCITLLFDRIRERKFSMGKEL